MLLSWKQAFAALTVRRVGALYLALSFSIEDPRLWLQKHSQWKFIPWEMAHALDRAGLGEDRYGRVALVSLLCSSVQGCVVRTVLFGWDVV